MVDTLDHKKLDFQAITPTAFPLVKQFYKAASYHHGIGRKDEVYAVRFESSIISALRLVPMDNYLLLRSMVVSPSYRGKGVGLFMLEKLTKALSQRSCWCFPFEQLESFYRYAGFVKQSPETCPNNIAHKFQQYRLSGKKIIVMKRD